MLPVLPHRTAAVGKGLVVGVGAPEALSATITSSLAATSLVAAVMPSTAMPSAIMPSTVVPSTTNHSSAVAAAALAAVALSRASAPTTHPKLRGTARRTNGTRR